MSFSWQCAKSSLSIPAPQATHHAERFCRVHLYLPEGQRIEGFLNGSGIIFLDRAFERPKDTNGKPGPEQEVLFFDMPEDHEWLMNAGGLSIDVFSAVGQQVIPDFQSRDDAFKDDNFDHIAKYIKIVRQDHYDPQDSYDTLAVSEPCRYGGLSYDSAALIKHLYNGDAKAAYLDEYTPYPANPAHNLGLASEQLKDATESLTLYAQINLTPDEVGQLIKGNLNFEDYLQEPEVQSRLTNATADDAFDYGDLIPVHCRSWDQAGMAFMAALQNPDLRSRLDHYASTGIQSLDMNEEPPVTSSEASDDPELGVSL